MDSNIDITYTVGPRFIDGVNMDEDVEASVAKAIAELEINDAVTGLGGIGYEPGQKNKDGSNL